MASLIRQISDKLGIAAPDLGPVRDVLSEENLREITERVVVPYSAVFLKSYTMDVIDEARKQAERGQRGVAEIVVDENIPEEEESKAAEPPAAPASGRCASADARPQPQWTADSSRDSCEICDSAFTLSVRRHHCRRCGALICKSCSPGKKPLGLTCQAWRSDYEKPVLHCGPCFEESPEAAAAGSAGGKNTDENANEDPMIARAGAKAYKATAKRLRHNTKKDDFDSQCDGLYTLFLIEVQEILEPAKEEFLGTCPGAMRSKGEKAMDALIEKSLRAVINGAWRAVVSGSTQMKESLQPTVQTSVVSLNEAKEQLKAAISAQVAAALGPVTPAIRSGVTQFDVKVKEKAASARGSANASFADASAAALALCEQLGSGQADLAARAAEVRATLDALVASAAVPKAVGVQGDLDDVMSKILQVSGAVAGLDGGVDPAALFDLSALTGADLSKVAKALTKACTAASASVERFVVAADPLVAADAGVDAVCDQLRTSTATLGNSVNKACKAALTAGAKASSNAPDGVGEGIEGLVYAFAAVPDLAVDAFCTSLREQGAAAAANVAAAFAAAFAAADGHLTAASNEAWTAALASVLAANAADCMATPLEALTDPINDQVAGAVDALPLPAAVKDKVSVLDPEDLILECVEDEVGNVVAESLQG